jgi:hypothetical protein
MSTKTKASQQGPQAKTPETLPVHMDARLVRLLNEICAVADVPPGEWFGNILENFLRDTVLHCYVHPDRVVFGGVIEDLTHLYDFKPEDWEKLTPRFRAIIEREKAAGSFDETETEALHASGSRDFLHTTAPQPIPFVKAR